MRRIIWTSAALSLLLALNASAQTTGGTTGGRAGGTSGGTTGGSTGGSSSGGTTGSASNFNNIANSFSATGATGGTGGTTGGTGGITGGRTGGTGGTSGTTFSVSTSNFLSGSFGNPLYPGRPNSTNLSISGGSGFGQPSFGQTTTTGTAGRTTGGTATFGRSTTGGLGGTATTSSQRSTSQVSHIAVLKFPTKAPEMSQIQTDLRGVLSRSSMVKNPGGIAIEVEGGTVVLKGQVSDDDQRRLVEGMMRLTPGVRDVRNELKVP